MNYTLNQLQVFLKIVQTESVTKAAEELHLTQPAVSIQLKNFQENFEIQLTEVVGRKIYITDFGREIAKSAESILNQVNAIDNKTLAYKGHLTGRLKISVVSTGKYIMPFFLSGFLKQNPGVELAMDVTNKEMVINSIENNEVDFSLVSIIPDKLNIEKVELMPNKLFFISNSQVNFKKKTSLVDIFHSAPFIYRESGSGTRDVIEKFFTQNDISITRKLNLTTNEAVKQAVIAGLGNSIMPIIGIKNELLNGQLKIIPVKGLPYITNWSLVWSKGKNHSPAATAFLKYLIEEKNNLIKNHFDWYENY